MDTFVMSEIVTRLKTLPDNLQRQVLIFVEALQSSQIRGTPGKQLRQFAGTISPDDLKQIEEAIEIGCEQVDVHGW